jgi:leucyl aminopeptidase
LEVFVKVEFSEKPIIAISGNLLAVCVGEDIDSDLAELDKAFDGHLLEHLKREKFAGKAGTSETLPSFGNAEAPSVLILGTGDGAANNVIDAAGLAGRKARNSGVRTLVLANTNLAEDSLDLVVEAVRAGNYEYQEYKPEDKKQSTLDVLVLAGCADTSAARTQATRACHRADHQDLARDLINGPAADITPRTLAEAAKGLAALPGVSVEVWDFERCKAEGLVGLVAVGQGSSEPGCLIHVKYRPAQANGHIALVGKGVTFDCGGLSIKPSNGMQTMRCDMGGGATVLGAIGSAAAIGLKLNVDCFVGAVENMVSGNSYKLGDVLRYSNGVTVEVHNTDAEGRLVLADCLIQACKIEGVTHVVDAATLTGACVVALGEELTAVFTSDDALANGLIDAADHNGEGMWRLPLKQSYLRSLKATWGQIKNVGSRAGGSITAALFLQHFVTSDVKWAHLDIAAASWYDKPIGGYAAGATGQGVRALSTWMERIADA